MFQYELTLRPYASMPRIVAAETAGKAKYALYMDLDDIYDSFSNFLRDVLSCKKVGELRPTSKTEDFDRVCEMRGIPFAKVGMKVVVGKHEGVVVGVNSSANLDVRFNDRNGTANCHPNSNITYYDDDGSVLAAFD